MSDKAKPRSPSKTVRSSRGAGLGKPPRPAEFDRRSALQALELEIAGRSWLIGPAVVDDPSIEATYSEAETVQLVVSDLDGTLTEALQNRAGYLADGARITLDGATYVLLNASSDEAGRQLTLTFEDEAAWRLRIFRSFRVFRRSAVTRPQAVLRLVEEASAAPYTPLAYWIPELRDAQPLAPRTAKARKAGTKSASTKKGTGTGTYTVKNVAATPEQRRNIDTILATIQDEGGSRTVMQAAIACSTQESSITKGATNGIHVGPFQQNPDYGSEATRRDPKTATLGFVREWKRVHGSIKAVPGGIVAAVEKVQRSGNGSAVRAWVEEAGRTVSTWLGSGSGKTSSSKSKKKGYEFTRGERGGESEHSWAAIGRWAGDVGARRWAQRNVFCYASDDELRAAAPALTITGSDPWLVTPPGSWEWGRDRLVETCTITVEADAWGLLVGTVVKVADGTPHAGRYLVSATSGGLLSPTMQVTLTRPHTKALEPRSGDSGGQTKTTVATNTTAEQRLYEAAKHISSQNRAYVYGGGHGPPLSSISPSAGLDCSSSCSLALKRAGMFNAHAAIVSGAFASSWGSPGKGKSFTVWANATHVWIEFSNGHRFDTSPYGSGGSGPRLRTTRRNDQGRFTARHWPGT